MLNKSLVEIVKEMEEKDPSSSHLRFDMKYDPHFKDWYNASREARRLYIEEFLERSGVSWKRHFYDNRIKYDHKGVNIVADISPDKEKKVYVACHYDSKGPGANDNLSSVALTMKLIDFFSEHTDILQNIGVKFIFFDQEETGRLGSDAYFHEKDTEIEDNLIALINLDMTGTKGADTLIMHGSWTQKKGISKIITQNAGNFYPISVPKFDYIGGDHIPFMIFGYDALTLMAATKKDKENMIEAQKIYASAGDKDDSKIYKEIDRVLRRGAMFRDYHNHGDTWDKISEETMTKVFETVRNSIKCVDATYQNGRF